MTMNVEIQNVYNRENVFLHVWNKKTGALDTLSQISFLPVAGLNIEF